MASTFGGRAEKERWGYYISQHKRARGRDGASECVCCGAAVHYTIMYNGCTASQYLKVDPLGRWTGAHFHLPWVAYGNVLIPAVAYRKIMVDACFSSGTFVCANWINGNSLACKLRTSHQH